jgi:hypothetical protein
VIEYRPAKLLDIPGIVDIAVESVSKNPLPVVVSRKAMWETLEGLIGKPAHFCWVAVQEGKVVASVAAMCSYGFWFERQQCSILLYYTRVPGACMPLLRELSRWTKSRPVIKLAVFELEPTADPRLEMLLSRLGFGRRSTNMVYVRSTK